MPLTTQQLLWTTTANKHDSRKPPSQRLFHSMGRCRSSKLLRFFCLISSIGWLCFLWNWSHQYSFELATVEDRCWLQAAFRNGDFLIGSHRSLGDVHFAKQPTCLEGLMQLNVNGIHYLDLDLIWDTHSTHPQLVVAHPTEFADTTKVYSPCAKQPLIQVLQLVQTAMPKWFVSLEPKADWDRKGDSSILHEPQVLLQETLRVMQQIPVPPTADQCTLIVDANKLESPEEKSLLKELAQYCSFSLAIRRDDDAPRILETTHYDYYMPTIESHLNHAATKNTGSIPAPVAKSIYWMVDTPQDLERVALVRGAAGIVSNRPLEVVRMVKDRHWCPNKKKDSKVR